ncbi:MAG TPA: hypothetical protein VJL29_14980 [Thermoguttaceae bacterium]|nr:hypothetical protein [Thermoguttaceae bacterium]
MTLLLESPIPVLFVGVVIVAILGVVFFQTGRAVALLAAGGVVLITLLGLGVEHYVVTEREAVETALYDLADAMEANDKNAAIACLSSSAGETRARAEWAFSRFHVLRANVSNLEIDVNELTSPPSAEARFDGFVQVRDRQGNMQGAENFYFVLSYRKEGGRWLVTSHTAEVAGFGVRPK